MSGLVIAHSYKPLTITGNQSLAIGSFYTCADSGASTQTLPTATGSNGVIIIENTGTGLLTVDGYSTETVNGVLTQILGKYQSVALRDFATGQWIIMY